MKMKKLSLLLALCMVLCFAFTACGGGGKDDAPADAEVDIVEDEDVPGGDDVGEDDVESSDDLTNIASLIGSAAMGVTEGGETIYFAEAKDSSFAILVFYDITQNANVSFVGPISGNGNAITVEDYNNGLTFTFTMEAAEGDAVVIDTGDSGYAVMAECDPMEVLEVMQSISDYSDALA